MTVESNSVIANATPNDWLKDSRQFFNQWDAKPKPIAPCTRDFSRASSELQVIARNCDWFMALSAPVVIGQSNCFGFGFSTVIRKPRYPNINRHSRIQLKIPLWEWSRMILAFSLRPIPFHQDNYSFQFDADNNSRCSCQFCFVLSGIFLEFLYSMNHGELITQPSN